MYNYYFYIVNVTSSFSFNCLSFLYLYRVWRLTFTLCFLSIARFCLSVRAASYHLSIFA